MRSSDNEILEDIKSIALEHNCSPAILVSLAREAIEFSKYASAWPLGPWPTKVDEAEIGDEAWSEWPEWVLSLVPHGCKFERLHWPDGSMTIRLVDARAKVIAAILVKKVTDDA